MTFGEVEAAARRYARITTSGASQTVVFEMINDSIVEFGRDANGLPFEEYLQIAAAFDLETHQAFNILITGGTNAIDSDIVVTSASASNQTGTQTAAMLQAQIRAAIGGGANLTVVWSKFKFTVDAIDSTAIELTSPDNSTIYTDYVAELFGGSQSVTATEVECGFPRDCTLEADLAADSLRVNKVVWDNYLLDPVPRGYVIEPEAPGDPYYYNIRGTKIRIVPTPTSQKKFYIEYKGVPARVTSPGTSTEIPNIPVKYQTALAYWVSKELLLGAWEEDLANRRYVEYKRIMNQYRTDYANNDTETTTSRGRRTWYSVGGASG